MNTKHNFPLADAATPVWRYRLIPRWWSGRAVSLAALSAALVFLTCAIHAGRVLAFGFDDVARSAEQLAAAAYKKPDESLPKELASLTQEQYHDIRHRPEHLLWREARLPFEIGFFHRGGAYFNQPVRIHEVTEQGINEIKFDPAQFDYGGNKIDPARMGGIGFVGLRVHFPVNGKPVKDEVLSFLGASYFRALGKDQGYGLSARALAADTGLPTGEEFPRFVEYWIERPAAGAKELVIYALLDSRRVAGAYRFTLKPGSQTAIDVKARLYLREGIGKLGVAPLTSMFFYGENQKSLADDYRPEVHDSDGLSVRAANGEWLWRPLLNPKRLLVTSFATANPLGFGLMQRDRDFAHYEDLGARYDLRPSAWVEPKGSWGAGRVELVQIPSPDETNDNIVAYWVPDAAPEPRKPLGCRIPHPLAKRKRRTAARRMGRADAPGSRLRQGPGKKHRPGHRFCGVDIQETSRGSKARRCHLGRRQHRDSAASHLSQRRDRRMAYGLAGTPS